jgi:CubicO group peptidase (beta-lactamase class C family)
MNSDPPAVGRDLDTVAAWFADNFSQRGEAGASVSVWKDGEEIITLHRGEADRRGEQEWTANTLVPVWSATKGVAAAVTLQALVDAGHDLQTAVVEVWPELLAARDGELTFADLLSHRAGLAKLDRRGEVAIDDYPSVIAALENQYQTGDENGHAYHARTFGFLLDEIVRRVSGAASLGEWWRQRIADPLDLDFWIGLPESKFDRVAMLRPSKLGKPRDEETKFYRAFADTDSFSRAVFTSPHGFNAVGDLNKPTGWQLGLPSMGGVGTARALGKFYAVLAGGGEWQGVRYFSPTVVDALGVTLSDGLDDTLLINTAFSAGTMKDPVDPESGEKRRQAFGPSLGAFGHPGAGGSHAFADPENNLSFAYTANQMQLGVLPNEKSLGMVRALYPC